MTKEIAKYRNISEYRCELALGIVRAADEATDNQHFAAFDFDGGVHLAYVDNRQTDLTTFVSDRADILSVP